MCSDPNFCAKYGVNVVEGDSRDIICSPSLPLVQTKPEQWAPWGFNSEYCLSEAVPETCSYNANLYTIVIVIICNAAKAITILYVAFRHQDNPLRTLGEAIQSFLNAPDPTTTGLCLLSKRDVEVRRVRDIVVRGLPKWPVAQGQLLGGGLIASAKLQRRRVAASRTRWAFTITGYVISLVLVLALFGLGVHNLPDRSAQALWQLGFGTVNVNTIIKGKLYGPPYLASKSGQVIASIIVANLPQLVLFFLYLNTNGLLALIAMAHEWSDFAIKRKSLRVFNPTGQQRGTYFLSLPYKIAIPLTIGSGLLH